MRSDVGAGRRFPPRPSLDERFGDEARFLKTWFENPLDTGALSPSSRALARTMARYVDDDGKSPLIELGPGTGPVTEALIERGIGPERLILVEFEPQFCELLARRYPGARIVQGDAYALAETLASHVDRPACAVVSSLPLLTRPEGQRLALLHEAFALMARGAAFVQFTYGLGSPMPRRPARGASFAAHVSPPVWLNLPPARVWVYRRSVVDETAPVARDPTFRLELKSARQLLEDEFREQGDRLRSSFKTRAEKLRRGLRDVGRPDCAAGAEVFDLVDARARRRIGR